MQKRSLAANLILTLGFLLRLVQLQGRPVWYDEAFAILYARLRPALMVSATTTPAAGTGAADVHPLLYYFSLKSWMELVGSSAFSARFLSVILGMLTVALLWRLAIWCLGPRTGFAVGVLAAVNPFHVTYSQEARMYALLGLTCVASTWSFFRALDSTPNPAPITKDPPEVPRTRGSGAWRPLAHHPPRWKWWGLYAVASALTLYTHHLGVFFIGGLHVLFATHRRWWLQLPKLLLADAVALTLFSPWLFGVLPGQIGFVRRGYWLTAPGAEELVRIVMLPVLTFYEPAPLWLLGLALFTGLLILVSLILQTARQRSQATSFLILSSAPITGLLLASQWFPVYLERALLPSALCYLVALGWILTPGHDSPIRQRTLLVLLALSTTGSLLNHYGYEGFPRPPFREAAVYLRACLESGEVIVHTDKLTYLPMRFYAPDLPAEFLADEPGSPEDTLALPTQKALGIRAAATISDAIGSASSVWVVSFEREVREIDSSGQDSNPLTWFDTDWRKADQQDFAGLLVRRYEKRMP